MSTPVLVHAQITQILLISSEFEQLGAQPQVCKVESEAREQCTKKQKEKNPASWAGRKDSLYLVLYTSEAPSAFTRKRKGSKSSFL